MSIKVTSKNRLAARRMLTAWHDAASVRTWPLCTLATNLESAIGAGRITREAAERALYEDEKPTTDDTDAETISSDNDAEQEQAQGQDTPETNASSESQSESKTEGEAESDGMPEPPPPIQSQEPHPFVTQPQLETARREDRAWTLECLKTVDTTAATKAQTLARGAHDRLDVQNGALVELQDKVKSLEEAKPVTLAVEKPDCDPVIIKGAHKLLPDVIRLLSAGLNIALVGPAGCGKSYLVRQACDALSKEFRGCNALQSKYDLIGYVDASGQYHPTPFFDAYTSGHLFCFDELDGSIPEAAVTFNSGIDGQKNFPFPHGLHDRHEEFIAVACMNTWGNGATADYVGRYKQDAASIDRFVMLEIDYDKALEATLGDSDIVERVHELRKAFGELHIRKVMSTRAIVKAQACRKAGFTDEQIAKLVFYAGLSLDSIRQVQNHINRGRSHAAK